MNKKLLFNRLSTTLLLSLMFTLILAACGEDDPTPTPEPQPTEAPAVEEATTVPEETDTTAETPTEVPEPSQTIYSWGEVAERLWVLVAYGDAANPTVVEEGPVVTAQFSSTEPTVSGSGGCNNYFAGYTATDDGGLTIDGPVGSTMMACETGGEQEITYFGALETVANWTITEEGRLELTYNTGQPYEEKLVYAPGETPLAGTTWQLVGWGDPEDPTPVEAGTSVTAVFNPETNTAGAVGGIATCNSYTSDYILDGDSISFGSVISTMMVCPVGAEQEAAYLAALESAQTFEIIGTNLFITYNGGVLHYSALNLPLANVLWQAVMVVDQPVPEDVEITVLFEPSETADAGAVGGSTGCNSFNSTYTTSHDLSTNPATHFLTVDSPMAMTMALCPDEALNQLEQTYLAVLETAETYVIFGDQLVISSPSGDIQFAANRQPLAGTLWQLVSLGDAENPQPPVEGSNFTAQFNRLPTLPSGTVTGETGCNEYNATFTANVNEIKVNLPVKTGNEDCPGGAGHFEQEQQFFLGLNAATTYRILGNTLQIPYGENGEMVLNFEATLPDIDEGVDLTPLADTFWYLLSIGDNPLISYTEITAEFEVDESGLTGTVSGSAGCNAYNGDVSTESGAFTVGPLATTAKACVDEVLAQEGGYLDWLSQAYAYDRVGDQLLISTANGVLTFNSTPVLDQSQELQNRTWYLVSVGNLTAVPGSNATTLFSSDGSSIGGNTGCNEFNGAYATEPGNLLTISGVNSTRAACASEDLTRQEEALLAFLPSAVGYVVVGNQMQIQTTDGSVINYTDIPPAAPAQPTAVIVSEDLGETGQVLTFDGSQSAPGDLPILSYQWEMGDGTVLSDPMVVYSFDTPGTYNVSLTVIDRAGQSNTTTKPIQISPVVDVQPPKAVIEGPMTATVGEPVAFSAASSQQGTAAIATYQWQSGDGNGTPPALDTGFTTIYAQPGVYYPSVTVADAAGLSDTAVMEITVNASIIGADWILSNTIPGTTINLNFANGSLSGFGGCNSYNGTYQVAGNSNNVQVGPLTSTGALCSEEIMNQEQAYFTALQSASSFTINGSTLTLNTATGPLVFNVAMVAPAPLPAVGP